jgi:antitoxin component YwqK of YwqJK toxin-antitoxin module
MKPTGIPRGARKREVTATVTEYLFGRLVVARIYRHASGAIEHEFHFDAKGRLHGIERECYEDGTLRYRASWRHGKQHGRQQQWSARGKLIVSQPFVRGTGFDVWFDGPRLSETREFLDGHRHGFERWWRTRTELYAETHFQVGLEHGIRRAWTDKGALRRGSRSFWLRGKQVSRQAYERALPTDPSLPPLRPRDDQPRRSAKVVARAGRRR